MRLVETPKGVSTYDDHYSVVLAYLPIEERAYDLVRPSEALYPEGLETVPKRFAISKRNDLMLARSEIVVCYVWHRFGGDYQFLEKSQRRNKQVINLA